MYNDKISILMSTYNEPKEYIESAINSILKQTYTNLELIVICDNPENTAAIELIKNITRMDSRVRFIINETNLGLTASLNKALQYASGEYIARMDADDIALQDRLAHQLDYIIANKLDLVGCNIQNIDQYGNEIGAITVFPESHNLIIKKARYRSPIAHPTWLGKKDTFIELNGYREIDACEDYDFIIRAILKGFHLGNIQETLFQYRINPNSISSTRKSIQKTGMYLIRKNYRKGYETTEKEYVGFMNSKEGNNKLSQLESYYKKLDKLKKYSNNRIKQLGYGMYIFITSHEGRSVLFNLIREKISLKWWKYYKN